MASSESHFITELQSPPGPSLQYPEPSSVRWPRTFADSFAIRIAVFCDEQHCCLDNELDDDDHRSWHWVIYADDPSSAYRKKTPVGTLRLVPPPHGSHPTPFENSIPLSTTMSVAGNAEQKEDESYIKLTRLAVIPEYRGYGLARRLVTTALAWAREHGEELSRDLGENRWEGSILIHAQVAVEKAWAKMGFILDEGMGRWDEEGITHLGMRRRVEVEQDALDHGEKST